MKRKILKRIMCASLALAMCLTGSISAFAEETTNVTLNNSNGGVGTVTSDVSANVSTSFTVKVPATISLSNEKGYCEYTGEVGIQGELQVDRAVSLAPTAASVVLTSGSEGASKKASVPVTQDQTVWSSSELGDKAMHCTNIHIAGTLDPGSWSGTLEFQVKINDITTCSKSGHDYDNNHMCAQCGGLEPGLYSLDKKLKKSWSDLITEHIATEANESGGAPAMIYESRITGENLLVVPGDIDRFECGGDTSNGTLVNLILQDGVKEINSHGRKGLTSVTIPGSVKSIEEYAFQECPKLSSVTIGDGVEIINKYAFFKYSSPRTVTLPRSITAIGDNAFGSESTMQVRPFGTAKDLTINYAGTKDEFRQITYPGGYPLDFSTNGSEYSYTVKCTDGTLVGNTTGLTEQT